MTATLTALPDMAAPVAAEHAEMWALVQRAQAGDRDAFGAIYTHYREFLLSYIYKTTQDREVAQDVLHDVFVKTIRNIGNFRWTGRDFAAYLITCARNALIDRSRSSYYRSRAVFDVDAIDGEDPGLGPEALALHGDVRTVVLDAMRDLTPAQREVVVLRYFNGLSTVETAQAIGADVGAVKALASRAIRRMARVLPPDAIELLRS